MLDKDTEQFAQLLTAMKSVVALTVEDMRQAKSRLLWFYLSGIQDELAQFHLRGRNAAGFVRAVGPVRPYITRSRSGGSSRRMAWEPTKVF